MLRTCWTGCSYTWGGGFDEHEREKYVYDRVVCKQMGWKHHNCAFGGASNYLLFLSASECLQSGKYDRLFVQWSALNRMWFYPGPNVMLNVNSLPEADFNYRGLSISQKQRQTLRDLIKILNHDFHNILQLIDYCCILEIMSKQIGCEVYFINGLVPWTNELAQDSITEDLITQLSPYTKEILDFDLRNDQEIHDLISILQRKFKLLPKHLWINLFDSMDLRRVDLAPLDRHPGIKSHEDIAAQIISFFTHQSKVQHA